MKVLIDGCVFSQSDSTEAQAFWQQVIPKLVARLKGHQIYYLNRSSSPQETAELDFPNLEVTNLFAPPVEWKYAALEDRRLKALCQEFGVDYFLSTYNTSAGMEVKSLVVVGSCPAPLTDIPLRVAQKRAVRLASGYLAFSGAEAEYLVKQLKIAPEQIRVIYPTAPGNVDWTIVANYCVKSLYELGDRQFPPELAQRRLAEEEATQAEAAALRRRVYGAATQPVALPIPAPINNNQPSTSQAVATSEIERLIPPEIKNDELYIALQKISQEEDLETVLEIGSSSGEGSTQAFVNGLKDNINHPTLFCVEVSKPRFEELQKRYQNYDFVKCYNVSSVATEAIPTAQEITDFYNKTQTALQLYPLDLVLTWLQQGSEYLQSSGVPENGIQQIKKEHNIDVFDLVLIDGSEFTGSLELDEVYGAKFIALDDINTYKNYQSHRRLLADPNYTLMSQNLSLRNGYSIFRRNCDRLQTQDLDLPIHFFTIVLNGMPFIQYHIDVFKQLPFKWHWHIIEGVADLKHDTAWSLKLGGQITEDLHNNGLSKDGTREYLDQLIKLYPEQITLYRKPEGKFWEGKLEMVNAPLANISENCLLWQVDVDELWTLEQICNARKLFINDPEKTAAFYWCWYFVGENLLISTRNCYAENPQQDWLRTWRFQPGNFWAAHEPPILVETLANGELQPVAAVNPFQHDETERQGLVFQHFAYASVEQLKFKEQYYGYKNAVAQWQALQSAAHFPVLLRQYFAWVQDETKVDTSEALGIVPILQKVPETGNWKFLPAEVLPNKEFRLEKPPKIVIDGVFFQLYQTGIARVWRSLLEEWVQTGFANSIVVLDRANSAPKIPGIWYRPTPAYGYDRVEADREMLQQVCDAEGADLFLSTYYTTPLTTPSVFMAYDMIPEVMEWNLNEPMWQEKRRAIEHASAYLSISKSTARDLVNFFPEIPLDAVTVAHCGMKEPFKPASFAEVYNFKFKYGISKPYFLVVGSGGYKNTHLFLEAFSQLPTKAGFEIVFTAQGGLLEEELRSYTQGCAVHILRLRDEELRLAYAGAVALVYPSQYEGFGLPILEALACGCPVITCPNSSIPEVAGEAAIYVNESDVLGLIHALCDVQKSDVRNSMIQAGLEQAQKFSWGQMAEVVRSAIIQATLVHLKLRPINLVIFPDWNQPEEVLGESFVQIIGAIASHPEKAQITLLIYAKGVPGEEADLLISSVAMNLLMESEVDVSDGPEITLINELSSAQWQALQPQLTNRLVFPQENSMAIQRLAANIPVLDLERFSQTYFLQ